MTKIRLYSALFSVLLFQRFQTTFYIWGPHLFHQKLAFTSFQFCSLHSRSPRGWVPERRGSVDCKENPEGNFRWAQPCPSLPYLDSWGATKTKQVAWELIFGLKQDVSPFKGQERSSRRVVFPMPTVLIEKVSENLPLVPIGPSRQHIFTSKCQEKQKWVMKRTWALAVGRWEFKFCAILS